MQAGSSHNRDPETTLVPWVIMESNAIIKQSSETDRLLFFSNYNPKVVGLLVNGPMWNIKKEELNIGIRNLSGLIHCYIIDCYSLTPDPHTGQYGKRSEDPSSTAFSLCSWVICGLSGLGNHLQPLCCRPPDGCCCEPTESLPGGRWNLNVVGMSVC